MPTDSYFYLARQLEKFMMSTQNMSNLRGLSNSHGLVRIKKMSMKNMSNSRVYYTDQSKKKSSC